MRAGASSRYAHAAVTSKSRLAEIDLEPLEVADRMDIGELPFWVAIPGNT